MKKSIPVTQYETHFLTSISENITHLLLRVRTLNSLPIFDIAERNILNSLSTVLSFIISQIETLLNNSSSSSPINNLRLVLSEIIQTQEIWSNIETQFIQEFKDFILSILIRCISCLNRVTQYYRW